MEQQGGDGCRSCYQLFFLFQEVFCNYGGPTHTSLSLHKINEATQAATRKKTKKPTTERLN